MDRVLAMLHEVYDAISELSMDNPDVRYARSKVLAAITALEDAR
jgi:hypothetical protein